MEWWVGSRPKAYRPGFGVTSLRPAGTLKSGKQSTGCLRGWGRPWEAWSRPSRAYTNTDAFNNIRGHLMTAFGKSRVGGHYAKLSCEHIVQQPS